MAPAGTQELVDAPDRDRAFRGRNRGVWAFWAVLGMPNSLLTGTAAATALALINSVGNLGGGFVGPLVMQSRSLQFGLLVGTVLAGAATVLAIFMPLQARRAPHDTIAGRTEPVALARTTSIPNRQASLRAGTKPRRKDH